MKLPAASLALSCLVAGGAAWAQSGGATVYRCPGPPVLYTDSISASEAKAKGCRTIEGAPVTVMPAIKAAPKPAPVVRSSDTRVDPQEQKARDADARRILEAELRREEERLAELNREYNNGEPERRGDEKNFQKYLDRVAELKSSIARKEDDIAAIKRELGKLP